MAKRKKAIIRHAYSEPERVQFLSTEPSDTRAEFASEANINFIISRFQNTGQLPPVGHENLTYGYAPAVDFREALEIVKKSEEIFANLPAKIRARFGNNPAEFLEFAENPANGPEMVSLGLATKRDTPVSNSGENPSESLSEALERDSAPSPRSNLNSGDSTVDPT